MKSELSIYTIFEEAGIPHFTGADSFALNGAFLGYGVDYVNLGENTADMIVSILVDGKDPATTPRYDLRQRYRDGKRGGLRNARL